MHTFTSVMFIIIEYEVPELIPAEEHGIGKEIAMASKHVTKGKFEKVEKYQVS